MADDQKRSRLAEASEIWRTDSQSERIPCSMAAISDSESQLNWHTQRFGLKVFWFPFKTQVFLIYLHLIYILFVLTSPANAEEAHRRSLSCHCLSDCRESLPANRPAREIHQWYFDGQWSLSIQFGCTVGITAQWYHWQPWITIQLEIPIEIPTNSVPLLYGCLALLPAYRQRWPRTAEHH